MNELQLFNFNGGDVRVITDSAGNHWFIASDVCGILEVGNTSQALRRLDDEERNTIILNDGVGNPTKSVVSESGLYSLVLSSRKPEAKAFKRWVTQDVLPAIRKHGGYLTPQKTQELIDNPDLIIQLATALKEEREKSKILSATNQKLKIKSEFADRIIDADEMIDVGQAAKILELPFGRNTLFERLRERGIFFKTKNEPKQEYIDRGYFILKEKYIERNNHDGFMVVKVLVTQKGLAFLHKQFPSKPKAKKQIAIT